MGLRPAVVTMPAVNPTIPYDLELAEILHVASTAPRPSAAVATAMAVQVTATDPVARDREFMATTVALAAAGTGATYPNPCVGALVVQAGRVVGAAHSAATGGPHAEVLALAMAGEAARGATVYVTLEPCAHHGRTPPCTDALIAAGVAEVVFGVPDPARHGVGPGLVHLQQAQIAVRAGVSGGLCQALHAHYLHHVTSGRPYIGLKAACSLDGQIAAASGDSRWITGPAARRIGHWLRARYHAILIGVDTLLRDNPRLSVRMVTGVDPVPVILDSHLRSAVVTPRPDLLGPGTWVVHSEAAAPERQQLLADAGVSLLPVAADARGRVDISAALEALGRVPFRSVLVEGGGQVLASFVAAAAWQRWYWFQAPCLLGAGIPVLPGLQWSSVAAAPRVHPVGRVSLDADVLTVVVPVDTSSFRDPHVARDG